MKIVFLGDNAALRCIAKWKKKNDAVLLNLNAAHEFWKFQIKKK